MGALSIVSIRGCVADTKPPTDWGGRLLDLFKDVQCSGRHQISLLSISLFHDELSNDHTLPTEGSSYGLTYHPTLQLDPASYRSYHSHRDDNALLSNFP